MLKEIVGGLLPPSTPAGAIPGVTLSLIKKDAATFLNKARVFFMQGYSPTSNKNQPAFLLPMAQVFREFTNSWFYEGKWVTRIMSAWKQFLDTASRHATRVYGICIVKSKLKRKVEPKVIQARS